MNLAVSQALLDAMPFFVMLLDRHHQIVAANQAVQQAVEFPSVDLCGQFCPKVIHGTNDPYPGCPLEEAAETGLSVEKELYDEKTGIWTLSAVYPTRLLDEQGGPIYMHTAQDITEEKVSGLELSQSVEHHKAVGHLLERLQHCREPEQVFAVLMDLTMSLSWMDIATAASGFLYQDDTLTMVASRRVAEDLVEVCAHGNHENCVCRGVAESGQSAIFSSDDLADHAAGRNGPLHGHATLPLTYEGRTLGVLNFYMKTGRNLNPSQLAYLEAAVGVAATALAQQLTRGEAIRAREEKIALERQILRRVLDSQEDERKRVSRELHDDLGQVLSALLLEIRAADGSSGADFISFQRRMERSIRSIIDRVAQLAWELRPTILDDYGLQSAISRFAQRLGDLAELDIDFQYVCPPNLGERLPPEVEVVLYRIAQESLNNVVRHAQARRVSVLLLRRAEIVTMLVEDDGRGFDLPKVLSGGGDQCIGLMGMQERASLLQGKVVFESAPDRGTTVKVTIPLEESGREPVQEQA
jgi:signal transduction histidine kinase